MCVIVHVMKKKSINSYNMFHQQFKMEKNTKEKA